MSAVKYTGPFDEVEVAGFTVKRLGVIEVPADLAKSLKGQEDWEVVTGDGAKNAVKNPKPPTDPNTGLDDPDSEPDEVPPPSNVRLPDNFDEPAPQPATAVNEPTNKES